MADRAQGEPIDEEAIFYTEAIYGFENRQPLVQILIGKTTMQVSTDDARAMADQLMQTAFAAEADAFLVEFFGERLSGGLEQAVQILADFRQWRVEREERDESAQ